MSTISLTATVHRRIRSAAKDNTGSSIEQKEALEWINLWKNRDNLHQNEANRLRQLTCNWEMICQKEAHIAITTYDNTYTLNPDHFTASVIIVDECSQTIEPAAMLPVVRFLKNLCLVILAGDDKQLRLFILSTSSENEFEKQLKKSWFERVRLSSVVPTITLTQQYRMQPEISRLVIQYFYAEELQDDHSVEIDKPVYTKYIELCRRLNQKIPI